MIQDLVDPDFDLLLAQLREERTIEITWPRIQPYLGHPLSKWLNWQLKMSIGGGRPSAPPTVTVGRTRARAAACRGPSFTS
jgi:hypothetical protein